MYFPIMGRNLFCWLLGWGLGVVYVCVTRVQRGVFWGKKGKEKKEKERKKRKLTCKNENFPPWQYTTLPISSPDVCKSKSLP